MRSILFYGDSNTYGYDPADFYENRYPLEKCWTTILQNQLGEEWNVIPQGLNGRKIPDLLYDRKRIEHLLNSLTEKDIFAVMLGTNDLLITEQPDAEDAVRKMREFLTFLTELKSPEQILLIAPVHVGNAKSKIPIYRKAYEENRKMNQGYRELAEKFGTLFADAGEWEIKLAADYVHFSEEGHGRFALKMKEYLQGI